MEIPLYCSSQNDHFDIRLNSDYYDTMHILGVSFSYQTCKKSLESNLKYNLLN